MKKNIIYLVFIALLFFGCGNFLEEKSQTEVRPSTVKDMEKLLEGDAYPKNDDGTILNSATDIFTDNIQCFERLDIKNPSMDLLRVTTRPCFAWEKDMFDVSAAGVSDISFWTTCYSRIKGCNVILDYMDGKTGDAVKREHLRGEAYALRGFYYLMLTNFFGMPYNFGNPDKNNAVPLKLISGVITDFDKLKRNSVAECYAQIEKDLLKGARLMEENKSGKSIKILRMNYLSAYALLSRMYLYMKDYDNALKYAEMVLTNKSELLDLKFTNDKCVYDESSIEMLWGVNETFSPPHLNKTGIYYAYSLSDDFIGVFGLDTDNNSIDIRGDFTRSLTLGSSTVNATYIKRGRAFLSDKDGKNFEIIWPADIRKGFNSFYQINGGIRTAELYLIRAEVYCHRYIASGSSADAEVALRDLNFLRSHRFTAEYVDKTISDFNTPNDLFEFCSRERRRELCGEGNHRWFDLRRLGMPIIQHQYIDNAGNKTMYTLHPQSKEYSLPIPADVINRNPSLTE